MFQNHMFIFILIVPTSVAIYSLVFVSIEILVRKNLFKKLFPLISNEADLSKTDIKLLDEACFEGSRNGILHYMTLAFMIINIPGVGLCNTVYHMNKEGASYSTVVTFSIIFYAVVASFIYFDWFLRGIS